MILTLFVMTVISFSLRYLPFALFRWLKKWTFLEKLSATLPACLMIFLVAHNLQHSTCGLPEVIGLGAVILTQVFFRGILLSMSAGLLCHQLLRYFL